MLDADKILAATKELTTKLLAEREGCSQEAVILISPPSASYEALIRVLVAEINTALP